MPENAAGIAWRWNTLDQPAWAALLAGAALPTLEQSWAYGAGIERVSSYRARRGVAYRGDTPVAMVQLFQRAIGPLTIGRILRGPLMLAALDQAAQEALLRPIAEAWPIRRLRPLFWVPELADAEATMRRLGKRPMIEGNATARIELAPDEVALRAGLEGNWRNRLVRAERAKLRVQVDHGGKMLDWLAMKHEGFRRAARHRGPSVGEVKALVEALSPRTDALVLSAFSHNEPVAGMLFVIHGRGATYHISWTSPEGRLVHAHSLLMWRGMLALKQRGVAFLDLGGLDATASGVARFKLGIGAAVVPMAATYL